MARKKSHDPSLTTPRDRKLEIIRDSFPKMRHLLLQRAAMQMEHIKPLADALKKVTGELKANTGVDREDWEPEFKIYMRDQNAIDMQNQSDTDRIQCNMKLVYDALHGGEILNFVDVLERMSTRPDPMLQQEGVEADDDGQTEHASAEEGAERGPAELTFASTDREEGDPMLEETAQAWGADDDQADNSEVYDRGGVVYHAGRDAGRAGKTADANEYLGEEADLWERGRIVGAKDFLASEAASIADEHEADEPATSAKVVNLFDEGGEGDGQDADEHGIESISGAVLGCERPSFPALG